MAYALEYLFEGSLEYIVIDLPNVLYSSALYLGGLLGYEKTSLTVDPEDFFDSRIVFVANYLVPSLAAKLGHFDLGINTMSMNEMSEPQVRFYSSFIRDAIGEDGLFYEENGVGHPEHIDCRRIFREYFSNERKAGTGIVWS